MEVVSQAETDKPKMLPITLLSGFLGSGKTTLLKHILENKAGLRCAVLVNDMAEINIDATLVSKTGFIQAEEKLIEMQNGCICCTLREDLLIEIAKLAKQNKFDYLIIESTGVSEPMMVAETFTFDSDEMVLASLSDIARLDTCVTVVDAVNFMTNWNSVETVTERAARKLINKDENTSNTETGSTETPIGDEDEDDPMDIFFNQIAGTMTQIADEDERNIVDLLVDQIEFANVILINKTDLACASDIKFIHALVKKLNPNAKVYETVRSNVAISNVINTELFDFETASMNSGWLQEMRGTHVPETEEYGISSFVYRMRKPFHPRRIYDFLDTHFVFSVVNPAVEEDHPDPSEYNKGAQKLLDKSRKPDLNEKRGKVQTATKVAFGDILRSKGFMWLAHDDTLIYEWTQAGILMNVTPTNSWFAAMDRTEWPCDTEEEAKEIENDFDGPYGDRRQEIVIIGRNMQKTALREALDACLVTDDEYAMGSEKWKAKFDDHDWPCWEVVYTDEDGASEMQTDEGDVCEMQNVPVLAGSK